MSLYRIQLRDEIRDIFPNLGKDRADLEFSHIPPLDFLIWHFVRPAETDAFDCASRSPTHQHQVDRDTIRTHHDETIPLVQDTDTA